jgi:uncharacterized membrane protein (UPF0127 family)
MIARIVAMAALALTLVAAPAWAQPQTFERDQLTIETAGGGQQFAVELAVTSEQRAQGLMYRQRLPADAGMLFVYPAARPVSMWIEEYADTAGRCSLATTAGSCTSRRGQFRDRTATISSMQPARSRTRELNGGTAARLKIQVGDRVLYRTFGTAD